MPVSLFAASARGILSMRECWHKEFQDPGTENSVPGIHARIFPIREKNQYNLPIKS
jgi:hypothetical protein